MKVLAGSFQCESNTFASSCANIADFEVRRGQDCLDAMEGARFLRQAGVKVEPLLYASALPSGMVTKEAFDFFQKLFQAEAEKNRDVDGIYLYLHGSMFVEGIGSGELGLIKGIRKVVGESVPISLALDFHANLPTELLRLVQAVHGFRTAPHIDQGDTERRAGAALLRLMQAPEAPRMASVWIPFLCADAAVTSQPPLIAVNDLLGRMDGLEQIVSAAFFNGQVWYDADYVGCRTVVSSFGGDAFEKASEIAKLLWEMKDGLTIEHAMSPEQAVKTAIAYRGKLLFVTDSGDNTTAGAEGKGTLLLKRFVMENAENVLICGIYDPQNTNRLLRYETASIHDIVLCPGLQERQEQEVALRAKLLAKGRVCGWSGEEAGDGVLLRCGGVSLALTNARAAFTTRDHFTKMGIRPEDYKVIVLKMGYLFPQIQQISSDTIFALTPGQSSNDFSSIPFQHARSELFQKSINWEDILERAKAENGISGSEFTKYHH